MREVEGKNKLVNWKKMCWTKEDYLGLMVEEEIAELMQYKDVDVS